MSNRRDFLRALASGTGAILIGKGWYKQSNLYLARPYADYGISITVSEHFIENALYKEWGVKLQDYCNVIVGPEVEEDIRQQMLHAAKYGHYKTHPHILKKPAW